MSDSNLRFDPYTGDPIPNNDEPNQPQDNTTPDPAGMQEPDATADTTAAQQEYSYTPAASEPYHSTDDGHNTTDSNFQPDNTVSRTPDNGYTNPAAEQPGYTYGNNNMYHTNDSQYIPGNSPEQQTGSGEQYNPYTGQPMHTPNQPDQNQRQDDRANIYGGVALGCGIGAILFSFASFCCCPFISFIAGIAGLIFGILAKNSQGHRNGVATAGIATAIIGIVLTIILSICTVIIFGANSNFQKRFSHTIQQYENQNSDSDDFFQ